LQHVYEHFADDVDGVRLRCQLSVLSASAVDEHGKDSPVLNHVNCLQELVTELKRLGHGRQLYTEVNKLVRLLLTIPVSSATAERSFSALRRLKTFTRSTITAARLNHIAILHTHQQRTDTLKDDDILQEFTCGVDKREFTFGLS
jgi:hypothetical protein